MDAFGRVWNLTKYGFSMDAGKCCASQTIFRTFCRTELAKFFHRFNCRFFLFFFFIFFLFFYLWCRFYQIRTALRVSPKLPVKVEVTLPRNQREYTLMTFIKPSKIIACSIAHFWDWNSKSVQMLVKAVQACRHLKFNFILFRALIINNFKQPTKCIIRFLPLFILK